MSIPRTTTMCHITETCFQVKVKLNRCCFWLWPEKNPKLGKLDITLGKCNTLLLSGCGLQVNWTKHLLALPITKSFSAFRTTEKMLFCHLLAVTSHQNY